MLTKKCNAIIQNKFPPKLKDIGSFSIPYVIGTISLEKVLCDLWESVSLKSTRILLQLADKSVKYPVEFF